MINQLIILTKVNNTDTSVFILKTKCDADKLNLEKKFSDVDEKVTDTSEVVKKNKLQC